MEDACITVKELRGLLWEELGPVFVQAGYKGSKTAGTFTRKKGKDSVMFFWDFSAYWPIRQEFRFKVVVNIGEIKTFLEKTYQISHLTEEPPAALLLAEGHFAGAGNHYRHEVRTADEARKAFRQTTSILTETALPRMADVSTLTGFQRHYLNNPIEIAENLDHYHLFESALAAAYLKGADCYLDVADYLRQALDKEKTAGNPFRRHYEVIQRIDAYMAKKP